MQNENATAYFSMPLNFCFVDMHIDVCNCHNTYLMMLTNTYIAHKIIDSQTFTYHHVEF